MEESKRRGILFLIVSPSGGGKSTICKELLQHDCQMQFSISYTSRSPRPQEVDGREYFFITKEQFRKKIDAGDFLEWAEYVGNFYGTERAQTESIREAGLDVLLDIDIQGADAIKAVEDRCVRIFITPPDRETLIQRLRDRGVNTDEEIRKRVATATEEIKKLPEFDYMVVNDDLESAIGDIRSIIQAERLKVEHQQKHMSSTLRSFGINV